MGSFKYFFDKIVNEDIKEESEYYRLRPYIAIDSDPFKDEDGNRIPKEAQEFYEDFGYLIHPRTGERVKKLSPYQLQIWNDGWLYKLRLVVKTHRAGVSESALMEDFQKAITTCRGYQVIIVMQTQQHANQLLYRLRKSIQASEKYSKYLINTQNDFLFRQEVTKTSELFINNPDSNIHPSRIIALGASEGSLWSWDRVKKVHMSDIAAARIDYAPLISAAGVRMATTDGDMLIETPPKGGTKGSLFEIWKKSKEHQDNVVKINEYISPEEMEGYYKVYEITYRQAIEAGIMSQKYIEAEKKKMSPQEFASWYEAQFVDHFGDLFDYDSIIACENRGRQYGLEQIIDSEIDYLTVKSIGYDRGHGSSNFGICALEWLPVTKLAEHGINQAGPGILRVIYCQEFSKKIHGDMVNKIINLNNQIRARKIYGGAVDPEVIRDIKIGVGERVDYEYLVVRAHKQKRPVEQYMQVVPINENVTGAILNGHAKAWVESGLLAIHPSYTELIRQMKIAVTKPNGQLDKTVDNYDSLDAFKNALKYFNFGSATGISKGHVFKLLDSPESEQYAGDCQ